MLPPPEHFDPVALAIMAKAPRAGAVKTRLVPPLTPEEAAKLSACFLADVAELCATVTAKEAANTYLMFTPQDDSAVFDDLLPACFRRIPQRGAGLTERICAAFEDLFSEGFSAACLLNADSPNLPARELHTAIEALRSPAREVVLGPAEDDGFYLVGLNRPEPRLFEGVAWSTNRALADVRERARELGLPVRLLGRWYDVDDAASLRRLSGDLFPPDSPEEALQAENLPAARTRNFLRKLIHSSLADSVQLPRH